MFHQARIMTIIALLATMILTAFAQRPRMSNDETTKPAATASPLPPAPQSVNAKYEGGVFGYNKKMEGTLNFEDANSRLVFRNDKQKEVFFIPYKAITGAYGDTHSARPKAATVGSIIAGSVVPFGGLTGLIKTKVRYLTLQYNDPDSNAAGVTSLRLENNDLLNRVLSTLANKAGLTARGEIFVRKKE